ncbi:radical SAM protein [Kitasatospora purpeofusca]|uniref:Radical SAM protein n=1 Tax=Kitasatospora purpeofusca TaxID=67352 RepID=A0ABZ1UBA6_9ACTN|nr:radical SAM protein [Kitasatospora purpeofusca]
MSKTSPSGDTEPPAFRSELARALTDTSLHLILLPTEQCNFRCTYCYEDFEIGRMHRDTVLGVKRLLDRRLPTLESLSISWFGGEPLLAKGLIEEVSAHIVESPSRPDLHYQADMTTNGYLLDLPTVEKLFSLGVRLYQISLDGPAQMHDRTRIRANGKGSFERIWKNLTAMRESNIPVNTVLRIHVNPENLDTMPEFLARVRDEFLADDRFTVHLKPVERMGGPNDSTMEILGSEARAKAMSDLRAVLAEGGRSGREFAGSDVCYASRANSLVIRANGTIGKCTVGLTDPANMIGTLEPDGALRIDNARLSPWVRGWAERDWSSVQCPYAGMPRSEQQQPLLQIASGPRRPAP